MTEAERHQRIKRVFAAAVDLPPGEREPFVREQCGGDDELRDEIMELLRHDALDRRFTDAVGGGRQLSELLEPEFSDGSLGARSALMVEAYEDEPDNFGIAVSTAEHLMAQIEKASRAGLAVHIHAIGDQANRNVLDAIEATRKAGIGLHLRHRIEHAQILHPDDVGRFAELDVIPSMQPIHCTQDIVSADNNWGDRCRLAYAWSTLLSTGAVLAFGSDAPVETPSIMEGLYAAVARRRADGYPSADGWYPEERLSIQEAVYAYTMGAAYAGCEESIKGSLTAGKLADLVVLDADIFSIESEEILETGVVATMVGGEFVYGEGW